MVQLSGKNTEKLTESYKQALDYTHQLEKEGAEYRRKIAELKAENLRQSEALQQEGAEHELKTRVSQQAIIAELGLSLLGGVSFHAFMDNVVLLISEVLQVEYCQILELLPNDDALLLRAGTGWREGLVGSIIISADPNSQIGYTLLSSEPIIVEDLRTETRFNGPSFLYDHDVVGSMSVIIEGRDWPFGVLGAHTTKQRTFTAYDVNFLQSIANMLAQAVGRTQAEEALRESEEKYRTLIEQSSEAIFLIHGGRFEVVNTKFEKLFGVTQEEANTPGFIFSNIIASKSKHILKQLGGSEGEPKSRPYYEFTALDRNGQEIEVELTVSYPTYKGGLATQGIIRDITDRKRIEEEKRIAYEQIQQYSDQLAERIKEEQRQREIATILAEVVASVSLTLTTDELLNHILSKLQQLIPYDSAAIFLEKDDHLLMQAARGFDVDVVKQEYPFEQNSLFQQMRDQKSYILIRDTQQDERYKFWLGAEKVRSWIGAPLLVAQKMIGYLTVDRYVPEAFSTSGADLVQAFAHQVAQTIYNAQLFSELRETQVQLIEQERLAALGQMAATVAHDLRNPLMAVRMGVEYFVQDLPEDDPRQQGAALMQTNIIRIDRIVDNILYVARASKPMLVSGSLYAVITNEIMQWHLGFDEKGITCRLDLADDLPEIYIDIDQIGRALSNLIGNSIDAMGPGGELHLTLYGENESQVITIADNGPGIETENQEKIFEPFFTTKLRGTGLGLSIVKQVVDHHQGTIDVWSEAGAGTKFIITLPQAVQATTKNTNEEFED